MTKLLRVRLLPLLMSCLMVEIYSGPTPQSQSKHTQKHENQNYWRSQGIEDIKFKLAQSQNNGKVKNVILIIGDGMGLNSITPGRIYKGQKAGKLGEEETLSWEYFPHTGLSKTYNTDYQVPDSAGTATAILSGCKTKMAFLGIDNSVEYNTCDPKKLEAAKLDNIFTMAIKNKKETGIVTTARLTHATPGAAYAATSNRDWEADSDMSKEFISEGCTDVAKQMIYSSPGNQINVLFGGGRSKFMKKDAGGKRLDEDLISVWKNFKKNVSSKYLDSKSDLDQWNIANTEYVLGLFGDSHLPFEVSRDVEKDPSFTDLSLAALNRLQTAYDEGKSNGFVLLLESGRIDMAHHTNHAKKAFEELVEMDRAVNLIMDKVNLQDTLVIVTADHSHAVTMNGYPHRGNSILGYIFEDRGGNYVTKENGEKIPYSTISYANGPGFKKHFINNNMVDIRKLDYESDDYQSQAMWLGPDNYESHGGEDVPIYAIGPQSHLFTGVHEQSYISHVIHYGMCQISDVEAPFCSSSSIVFPSMFFIFINIYVSNFYITCQ
ncbi:alkaline phosphatase, tissue-nonspecific isozyme [Lepeophtheirus salmonis]|uniref:alkaline phosphatase, tissue-nonspecific isozyme n=1 Tax=Lepeophtheirus salmonis TaxID=72036 RepID=UPI001AE99094|nr:alkaline phosphatase, tissue-nonspecific isozyme-like [Lepeophtheirus salmonis]